MGLQDLRLAKENTELETPRSFWSIHGLFITHPDPEKMGVTDTFCFNADFINACHLPVEAAGLAV